MARDRAWSPVRTLAASAVTFGLALLIGVDLGHCLLLALGAAVLVLLGRLLPEADDDGWPERESGPSDRGVRREVARLSWGLHGYESRVDRRSVARLRAIADRRLAGSGVDLDEPADAERASGLLGRTAYAALTGDPNSPPRYEDFARAVAAVEQLPTGRTWR